jgi:hypothetical protein
MPSTLLLKFILLFKIHGSSLSVSEICTLHSLLLQLYSAQAEFVVANLVAHIFMASIFELESQICSQFVCVGNSVQNKHY